MTVAMRRLLGLIAALLLTVGLAGCGGTSGTTDDKAVTIDSVSGLPEIAVSELSAQARQVLTEIADGGPFEYPAEDGSMFRNDEGILPEKEGGYYREYTVDTPGSSDRGARRIITGEGGELYWTADHYAHFSRVEE